MITIHKYNLHLDRVQMPKSAKILSIKKQGDDVYIWAQIETQNEMETRHFERSFRVTKIQNGGVC